MEFLFEYGLFTAKLATFVVALVFVLIVIAALKGKGKKDAEGTLKFTDLMAQRDERRSLMEQTILEYDHNLSSKERSKKHKAVLKDEKSVKKNAADERLKRIEDARREGKFCPDRLFVIDFDGDTRASNVNDFQKEVNAVLDVATCSDEVIVNLKSPGGVVNGYGLCASVLERITSAGVRLTVCVDEVAASGGYLMACTAHQIIAAPFAYIGSIGVVASMPNFNKVLKKHDVEYEQVTAGEYKRTLTVFGENTDEGRMKFKSELEAIHLRFKEIVKKYRPKLDIDAVSTGEFWLASDALERGLIDRIDTFEAYLNNCLEITKVCAIKISIEQKEKKGILSVFKKFFKAKTWTNALRNEIDNVMNDDRKYRI